jgi:hypothetical protein
METHRTAEKFRAAVILDGQKERPGAMATSLSFLQTQKA